MVGYVICKELLRGVFQEVMGAHQQNHIDRPDEILDDHHIGSWVEGLTMSPLLIKGDLEIFL